MQSLTFVLEATLLAPLVEFAMSSSGHVEPRQGLALGWLGSVVAGLAVVFGTADRAQANPCSNIDTGKYGWVCSCDICALDHNGEAQLAWNYYYYNSKENGCEKRSHKLCNCPV